MNELEKFNRDANQGYLGGWSLRNDSTLFLIVIVILAIAGLGWMSFTVGVLDGIARALDIGIPIIRNLTSSAAEVQETNAAAAAYLRNL